MTYPITTFPHRRAHLARPFDAEGTFIDGMKVLFDERVELTPADLIADSEDDAVSTMPANSHEPKQESFFGS